MLLQIEPARGSRKITVQCDCTNRAEIIPRHDIENLASFQKKESLFGKKCLASGEI